MAGLILCLIICLPLMALLGVLFGAAARRAMADMGYSEDWFWWGFFFGALALLATLCKPDLSPPREDGSPPPPDPDVFLRDIRRFK